MPPEGVQTRDAAARRLTDSPARLGSALAHRYRLGRELGQWGMATVYLAEDLRHGRKVAIKVLHGLTAVRGCHPPEREAKVGDPEKHGPE